MKQTRFVWTIFLAVVIIAAGLLLHTQAKNSYLLPSSTVSSSPTPTVKLYTNTTQGFQISYPSDWIYREYEGGTGVGFRPVAKPNDPQYEYITISVMPKPANIANLPFDQYVKVAGTNEIQNYLSLSTIHPVKTATGVEGFTTTWMVQPLGGGKPTASLPITYFPAKDTKQSIELFLQNKEYLSQYTSMVPTFRYTNDQ